MWNWVASKLWSIGIFLLGLLAIALMGWRLSVVEAENRAQQAVILSQSTAISEMKASKAKSDRIAGEDSRRSHAAHESETSRIINLERTNEKDDGPLAPVLRSTVECLFGNSSPAGDQGNPSGPNPCL